MGTRRTSYITWAAALAAFLAAELLALARRHNTWLRKLVPWYTASETVWATERAVEGDKRSPARRAAGASLRVAVLALFVDLGVHLAFGTSLLPL